MNKPADISVVYEKLVEEEIGNLFESARGEPAASVNERQLRSYWTIGQRITELEQEDAVRAQYGEALLDRLASSLAKRYQRGFSARNLRHMRRFYLEYAHGRFQPQLGWTHYRVLLGVADREKREELERLAAAQGLSNPELARLARAASGNGATISPKSAKPRLARPRGGFSRYAVEDASKLGVDGPGLLLDLGFHVRCLVPDIAKRGFAPGDIVEVRQKNGAQAAVKLSPKDARGRYVYAARLGRVIDGDTIVAYVDLGFRVVLEQKLRLRGLDAPEIGSSGGDKAKRYVTRRLRPGQRVVVRTYAKDRYDRYMADVFYDAAESRAQRIFENGCFLNQELLDQGLAVYCSF